MSPQLPSWMVRAKTMAARMSAPGGKPFAASKKDKTCKLYLYDQIGKDWYGQGIAPQDVVDALAANPDATELEVHINSPGGVCFDGIAIYNAIKRFEGQKTVYVDGVAASMASVIALAGDRVITSEGATWMIHEVAGGVMAFGTADQIEEDCRKTVTAIRKLGEQILDIYVRATGQSVSDLLGWMAAETWMSAAEAKERGFTDEIAKQDDAELAPEEARVVVAPVAVASSPGARADLARAKARSLRERFSGASPGAAAPGQPGSTNMPGPRRKDARGIPLRRCAPSSRSSAETWKLSPRRRTPSSGP